MHAFYLSLQLFNKKIQLWYYCKVLNINSSNCYSVTLKVTPIHYERKYFNGSKQILSYLIQKQQYSTCK